MLDLSRPERYIILTFLFIGLVVAGLSYYKKIAHVELETINIEEKRFFIDINTADMRELERLPGIGPVLATEIIGYRGKHGGFKDIKELKKVKGIGQKKFKGIEKMVTVDGR